MFLRKISKQLIMKSLLLNILFVTLFYELVEAYRKQPIILKIVPKATYEMYTGDNFREEGRVVSCFYFLLLILRISLFWCCGTGGGLIFSIQELKNLII